MKDFYQLFIEELKEIYSSENQAIKALPEMIKAARSAKLKELLKGHLEETKSQAKRLEKIAAELGEDFTHCKCDAMQGLLKEWEHVVKTHYQNDVQDAAIISFMQKVKHYEIASYGSLRTFAKHLNKNTIEQWLKQSIMEEGNADKKLTEIAEGSAFESGVNVKACKRSCA